MRICLTSCWVMLEPPWVSFAEQVVDQRPAGALDVDGAVLVEAGVLDRDDRLAASPARPSRAGRPPGSRRRTTRSGCRWSRAPWMRCGIAHLVQLGGQVLDPVGHVAGGDAGQPGDGEDQPRHQHAGQRGDQDEPAESAQRGGDGGRVVGSDMASRVREAGGSPPSPRPSRTEYWTPIGLCAIIDLGSDAGPGRPAGSRPRQSAGQAVSTFRQRGHLLPQQTGTRTVDDAWTDDWAGRCRVPR